MRMFIVVLALSASGGALANPKPESISAIQARGEKVAVQYCGACHAVGKTDASPNPKSPIFRTIFAKQPAGAIAEDLREGLKIGHKTMPRIQLVPDDVDALMAYLASIQETQI